MYIGSGTQMKVYRAKNIDEAIDLATSFRESNQYNWFRGQTQEWPVNSGLSRLHLAKNVHGIKEARDKIDRFYAWLENTTGLEKMSNDPAQVLAIAQHYGIPTTLIDFSTDPATAGFFASDTRNPPPAGTQSCIYCLNTQDLLSEWKIYRTVRDSLPEIECVTVTVPNLWRLEAQHGVFLYCPANWETWYSLDKIVFPYTGYPAYPTQDIIYPSRKSPLEILLDQFFMRERALAGRAAFDEQIREKNIQISRFYWDTSETNYHAEFFKDRELPQHLSWDENNIVQWQSMPIENASNLARMEIPLTISPDISPLDFVARLTAGVERALDRTHNARRHHITWRIGGIRGSSTDELALRSALDWLWDGMRILPYSNRTLAEAVSTTVGLHQLNFHQAVQRGEAKEVAERLFGKAIGVEFGAPDGSHSKGYASIQALQAAVRDDLKSYLLAEHERLLFDIKSLLQVVFSPHRVFEFQTFCDVFARQVIPCQVLGRPGTAAFFSPARLWTFGLP